MIFNPVFEAADKYFKCFLARLSFAGITHFFKPFQENNIWVVPGSTVVEHSQSSWSKGISETKSK
jgi:hypothetical protein